MSTFKELSSKSAQTTFDKKVLSVVQHLHPYVKHRIYIAESTRVLPKNMYSSTGIIDDSIIELYSNGSVSYTHLLAHETILPISYAVFCL